MPAITLARLRQQAALLGEHSDQPAAFVRGLHHLLDFYADRTHRPGQSGEPPPLLAAYSVPSPVLRQILTELVPFAASQPEKALELSDALWAEPYLEFRLLAAALLGRVPPDPPEQILCRVQDWIKTYAEDTLVDALLTQGLERLRQEAADRYVQQVEDWLNEPSLLFKQLGLRALIPLISSPAFENLPLLFTLLNPYVRLAPAQIQPDLLDLLAAFARRSPKETAFFLRQNLEAPNNPDTAWLIRQSLPAFPPEIQENLRSAVRTMGKRK